MKTIFRIAKTELRTLFYSPIAWFLLVVFLIQCAITYFGQLENATRTQELAGIGLKYMTQLTERIFASNNGLFSSVMEKLYLFIPLLTMGLISREMSSGTIKLLYSSPVRVREIIFGKFLAMMIYNLLLLAIISIFLFAGMSHIVHADGGMLLSSALGFYLLLCAYSAIGLFMSCLTTYQVVAAVSTFVMIGILSYIGTLWQDIDFVRDLTYFLSLNGRASKLLLGLITTKDVLYFVVIMYIFLGLSIYRLQSGMESKPVLVKAGRYAAIVISALLIGYVFSLPRMTGYLDLTANKSRTLTPNAQRIIKELDGAPLEVTTYVNLLDRYMYIGLPIQRNADLGRWERYMRFKNDINLHYVLYYDSSLTDRNRSQLYPGKTSRQIAELTTKSVNLDMKMFKTPEEIRKMIDLRPELNRYVMQLKYKDRTTFLRVFDDNRMWPGETEVAAAFKRLLQAKLPKIVFVTGDLERSIDRLGDKDYKTLTNLSTFRYSLVNQGFDVDTVSLDTRDIPADASALVLADPKIALSPTAMDRLKQYIDKGGNLLVAGEPGRQSILNPLLQPMGVQLMEGQVVQQSKDLAPDIVALNLTDAATAFNKPLVQSKKDSDVISMPGAVGLSYTGGGAFNVTPLLLTDGKRAWSKKKKLDLDMVDNADASGSDAPAAGNKSTGVVKGLVNHAPVVAMHKSPGAGMPFVIHRMQDGKPDSANGAAPGARQGNTFVMSPEAKKRSDSLRNVFSAIVNGPGTTEEKKQKTAELMLALRQQAMERAKANGGTIHIMHQAPVNGAGNMTTVAKKETPVEKTESGNSSAQPVFASMGMSAVAVSSGVQRPAYTGGTVTFSAADGDVRGPVATALSLTRQVNGKEQRIIVAGDADFMSNAELRRFNLQTANFAFNTGLFSWLSYGEFPIDTSRPDAEDKRVTVSMDTVDRLKIIFIWILPAILIAAGAILLIRRKRK